MRSCPSLEQLEQLLEEQLGDGEHGEVAQHVSDCTACQAALEQLTDTNEVSGVALAHVQRDSNPSATSTPFLARMKETPVVSLLTPAVGVGKRMQRALLPGGSPPIVPGYEIVRELGRGGMGVVYQALQVGLNRMVALKMILAGAHADAKRLARFRQEAAAIASLGHPNIVQIHEIGEADGIPFFALEFVEAGNLGQWLHGDPQPLEPAVWLVEMLARTVHFAHQHGIVHCDLKPANILLVGSEAMMGDRSGHELPLGTHHAPLTAYQPKITDFGLAKRLDEHSDGTPSGEIVGTPSYMAPEQAAGQAHRIGAATDVYALGAILYEMLTGRPPFKGAAPVDTLVQVIHEEPVRPSSLRPSLPLDLETICLKCLSKEPARRYGSAAALASDLRRYRTNKPILARPVGPVERLWKSARRRPVTAALIVCLILSGVLGFGGVTWQWLEARQARDIAQAEERDKEQQRLQAVAARAEAIEERRRAQNALYFSRIAQSQLQFRVNNLPGAVFGLARCVPDQGQEDLRGWEWHYLYGLFHSDLMTLYHAEGGSGGNAVFDPTGQTIVSVVGGHLIDDAEHRGELRVWDASTGTLLSRSAVPGTVHRVVFRPDGKRLALATTDGSVLVRDATTGAELLRTPAGGQMVQSLAYSPDGRWLALAGWDRTVKVCNADTGAVLLVLHGHTARVQSVAFHPDGTFIASGDGAAVVKLWDIHTGKEKWNLVGHKSAVYGVAFSPDGKLLASGSSNGNLKIWELESGRAIQSLTFNSGAVLGNSFSPDGRYLAYSGGDSTVRVWDVETGVQRLIYRGHTAPAESVHFSSDGRRLVSSSPQEGTVKVWDLTRHPEYGTFARVRGRADEQVKVLDLTERVDAAALSRTGPDLEALAFHGGGKDLVSVAIGGNLQTWDAATGMLKAQRSLPLNDELVTPAVLAAFNADGSRIAGRAREDKRLVKAWQVADGAEAAVFHGHRMPVFAIRYSRDGTRLATCACDIDKANRPHEIMVWDAATGAILASRNGEGLLLSAAFSPDGRWLAVAGQDGVVLLLDWAGTHPPMRLTGHKNLVAAVAFSGDGKLLASAGVEDRMLNLWMLDHFDAASAVPPNAITLAAPPFLCDLAFSPDGKRLAGISRDVVKLWDVGTRHEVMTLRGAPQRHWDPAFNPRVLFSPDGKRLVGTSWDESISMWDASIADGDAAAVAGHQLARRQAADARAVLWHLEQAEDCRDHQNPAAARFHLLRLGDAPLPAPLQMRRDRLTAELVK